MDSIFHELQEGSLCAQHCLNSLLQGPYFTAVDLATIANDLDEDERRTMALGDKNSSEYQNFIQKPSENMDDSGYFSIQVICKALAVWNLDMISYNSRSAENARKNPVAETAYICNQQNHWLTIRKINTQWFNLNSIKAWPELISDTYLSLLLAQLQTEGYSIFVIRGKFSETEADRVLKLCGGISKQDYEIFDSKKRAENKKKNDEKKQNSEKKCTESTSSNNVTVEQPENVKNSTAEIADPSTLRNKRLKYFDKNNVLPSSEDEDDMLRKAIELSNENVGNEVELTEEETLKAAMELSMQQPT